MVDRKYTLTFWTKFSEQAFQNTKINFIGSRKFAYIFSSAIIIITLLSLGIRGLNPGIDFTGGRSYVVRFDQNVSTADLASDLRVMLGESPEVKTFGSQNQVKITTKYKINEDDESIDNEVDSLIYVGSASFLPTDTSLETFKDVYKQSSVKVGPTIAIDLRREAFIAVFFALLAIFLYILVRFKNWSYGTGAVIALFHDALVIVGMFSVFYNRLPFGLEVDQAFIAAILTIIGYSINDTVVIFDRAREYIKLYPKRDRVEIINSALNDTLSRTFSTSFSTLVVLIPIFLFGGDSIRGFIFGLIIGIIFGTYSSLFIASPIAYDLQKKRLLKAAK
jgi:SecD/SecF fusion protein